MLNYGFAFAEKIRSTAIQRGASESEATYAIWPIVLTGGFLRNLAYSVYLLRKRRTYPLFKGGYGDAALGVGMGILWMASLALYGMSAAQMGNLGTSVGWELYRELP